MSDLGFTHVALSVRNLADSIAFYTKYARMRLVHQRTDADVGIAVAWMTDGTRPFVIVLAEWREQQDRPLGPFGHLGVGCESRRSTGYAPWRAPRGGSAAAPPTPATRSATGPISPIPTATTSRFPMARMSGLPWSARSPSLRVDFRIRAGRIYA